ncbi:hypothetical protein AB5I41_02795 [Sphingomonas sp. MMS24-JH45]
MRGALEEEGRTAALVTPDRALARRVAAHCRRWGIDVDDSAGRPLSILPPGTLLTAIVEAAAGGFAPLPLLTLLKHPLVRAGERRGEWLESGVRRLDRALRGPRPAPGLAGVDAHLRDGPEREKEVRAAAVAFWPEARRLLERLGATSVARRRRCRAGGVRARGGGGAGGRGGLARSPPGAPPPNCSRIWRARRRSAGATQPQGFAALLRLLMDEVAIRRAPGDRHPQLQILGLLEAQLRSADLMILGGLNKGVSPGVPAPTRGSHRASAANWGYPAGAIDRGGGARFRAGAGGAHSVADAQPPRRALAALASRFWLRLEAIGGGAGARGRAIWSSARALDDGTPRPAARPAPVPPAALRARPAFQ